MPLAGWFISPENFASEIKIPLELYVCENCKLAQICHIVDPDILFKNYFYISSVIKSLSEHFREYSIFLEKNYLNVPWSKLLEMWCNDGVLLQYFQNNRNISTLGIDPSSNVSKMAQDKWLDVINDFFNVASAEKIAKKYGKFDVLTWSNMFAHIDDIMEIIQSAKMILKDNGVFIFEVHYLYDLLKDFQYDTIYHEHLTYYSVIAIKKIFELQKMKVIDVIHLEMHGWGIRVVTTMEGAIHPILDSVEEFIQKEKEYGMEDMGLYKKMGEEIILHREKLTHMLLDIKNSWKSIVGYGAPGRWTILLNYCNIGTDILDYIVDVSPLRKGMYMPWVHVPIVDPSVAHNSPPDYFLVLAWNYIDSILSQEKILHDQGVKFIVPFPTIHIR
jgi:ubiquinone/menaquinone biosynthesis C-methylase UbiE